MDHSGNAQDGTGVPDAPDAPPAPAGALARLPAPARKLLRVLLLAAAGAVFFVFHGLSFHLTPWSQAFVNAIVKYTYPHTGQQDTTVLLFREENLQSLGTHFPIPHAFHAQVLEALASYGPRAVFVDFAFIDPRNTEDTAALAAALCALKTSRPQGTEVYLAAPAARPGVNEVLPALRACGVGVSPAMDTAQGVSGVLTYAAGDRRGGGFVPSAAFATARGLTGIDPARAENLEIIWGNGVWPTNRRWMGCQEPDLLHAAKEVLTHGPLALKRNCPYSRTLTVGHLLQSSGDPDIAAALEGRTVFYGGAFEFTGDRVTSPVYAELPGVYLHAMAHDNLVSYGADYKRAERGAKLLDAVVLLVTAAVLVLLPRSERWGRRMRRLIWRMPRPLRRLFLRLGPPPKLTSRRQFVAGLVKAATTLLAVLALLALAFQLGGLEATLWVLLIAYFVYRIVVNRDAGFAVFLTVMIVTGILAYYHLDLGPRNVLAYFAFFEVVRHLQHRLEHAHEVWGKLHDDRPASPLHRWITDFLSWYGPEAPHGAAARPTPAVPASTGEPRS